MKKHNIEFNKSALEIEQILKTGEIQILEEIPTSSNLAKKVKITSEEQTLNAIYKPAVSEKPLIDFNKNLYLREVAAYEFSKLLNWEIIPATVEIENPGSLQVWIDNDPESHYFTIEDDHQYQKEIQQMCLFDFMANNTDRKSGHCLLSKTHQVWGIDQGLCFHEEYKLRTVIWKYQGQKIPEDLIQEIVNIRQSNELEQKLNSYLTAQEIKALLQRIDLLLKYQRFPIDETNGYRYPWPLID